MFAAAINKAVFLKRDVEGEFTKVFKAVKKAYRGYSQLREANRISRHFAQFFRPVVANEKAALGQAFGIRHQVFCEELGLFPQTEDKLEHDVYDEYASQCLIQHNRSTDFAGTVRIIMPENEAQLLPIEKIAKDHITRPDLMPSNFPRNEVCEISRIAIPKAFRRRAMDKFEGAAQAGINIEMYSEIELRCFPLIAVGLYMATAAMALKAGKKHAFFMVEPRLAKSMKFIGIKFEQIGNTFEYVGTRAPFYINYEDFLDNLSPSFKHMMNEFTQKMD